VGVIGCEVMGSGIAQAIASAGFEVTVLEAEQRFLDKGFANMKKSLGKLAEKGKLKDSVETICGRLKGTTSQEDLADCDLIIEAVVENVAEKQKVLAALDGVVKKDAIFASNTSSISITELMTATNRHERFIGFHFSNPAPLLQMVEVVRTITTASDVYESAVEFAKAIGKVPIRTSDKPGFILNRLLIPYMLDGIRAYEEGVGSIPDIDATMKLGAGHPMGPFRLLDLVGLDTMYNISIVMFDEFKERRFAAPTLLKRMVMAGWLGRKTGRGFYDYSNPEKPEPMDAALQGTGAMAKTAAC
jgi:3-hydroxybutyryl-CoA dehydrogenase